MTGGLRFPICELASLDLAFDAIARDVITEAEIGCDLPLPDAPDGRDVEPHHVIVFVTGAGRGAERLALVQDAAECAGDSFYVDTDRFHLCPATCARLRDEPGTSLEITLACE